MTEKPDLIERFALNMYADEPCRICGQPITAKDLDNDDAVFAGYSVDNTSRVAHRRCWEGFADMGAHILLDNEKLRAEAERLQARIKDLECLIATESVPIWKAVERLYTEFMAGNDYEQAASAVVTAWDEMLG